VATQLDSTDLQDDEVAGFAVQELTAIQGLAVLDTGELDIAPEGADESSRLADAKSRAHRDHDVLRVEDPWSLGYDWPVVIWIAVVHLGALAAPFYFTWKAFGVFALLCWLTGSVGVCMGYHRYLTHGSFATYRWVRWTLALLGGLSGEGSALTWVANHRKHHLYSDHDGDPHTPNDGNWWSHMLWFMPDFGRKHYQTLVARFAPDLSKDPVMRFLHGFFLPSHVLMGGLLYSIGYFGWDTYTAISFLVWGMFVRLVYVLHVTWFVNSATHLWGYRNYETSDNSRNLWWVGLLAFGEGWHNNHHAFQRMARQGHRWWEIDMTYWSILALEKVGLAWNVVKEVPKHENPA
jgi:stearoyl-CoA desaturase (delta-9 desaturase)